MATRCVLPLLAALVILQTLDAPAGSRPSSDLDKELSTETALLVPTEEAPKGRSARGSSVRHAFNATALATGLPMWAVRAAAWPVMMHPGVAVSVAALDMAVSCANLSDATKSYAPLKNYALLESSGTGKQWDSDSFYVVIFLLTILVLWLVLNFGIEILFGCYYKANVTNQRPDFPDPVQEDYSMADTHDFHHNVLTWCGLSTFLFACFCPAIRHADTLQAAGLSSFWFTLIIFMVLELVFGGVFAYMEEEAAVEGSHGEAQPAEAISLLRGLVFACIFVRTRRMLRVKFDSPDKGSLLKDCFWWACCLPCAVAQEGRQVDGAQDVHVACLCRLTDLKTGDVLGEPVAEPED